MIEVNTYSIQPSSSEVRVSPHSHAFPISKTVLKYYKARLVITMQ